MRSSAVRSLVVGAWVVVCAACSSSSSDAPAVPPPPAVAGCADGFESASRGFCVEIAPAAACAPGTRPQIGKTTCVAVGTTKGGCPSGTVDDPSGWGCRDVRPEGACDGASRETVDSPVCVPIGDCNAAFPPPGAIVVDASLGAAKIDATHFVKIADAVAAAPAGATVAIERGTYAEDVHVQKTLKLVGRCAAEVRIEPSAPSTPEPGVVVEKGAQGVALSGFTVKGHYGGIDVFEGSQADISDVVVESALAFGILVDGSTATIKRSKVIGTTVDKSRGGWAISAGSSDVTVDDSFLVGGTVGIYAGTTDALFSVSRVVVTGQAPQAPSRSAGAYARGGRITIERSLFHDLVGDAAVSAELPRGIAEVRDSILRDIKVGGTLARGYGAVAFNGGEVEVRGSTIAGAESVGVLARDTGSIMRVFDSVVRGPSESHAVPDANLFVSSERAGMGVQSVGGATLALDGVAVIDTWGFAVVAQGGATLAATGVLVDGTRPLVPQRAPALPFAIGISADHASVTVDDVAVTRTLLTAVTAGRGGTVTGKKLYVRDVQPTLPVGAGAGLVVSDKGQIDLDASAIFEATAAGVLATFGPEASLRLARSSVHGTRAAPDGAPGPGVVVLGKASAELESTSIFDNAAYGVAASSGRARFVGCVVAKHPIAMHVQRGSFLVESDDDAALGDGEVRVSTDSRFLDNESRTGGEEVPLPTDLVLP